MARILIIDDSPTELHLFQGMLEKNGFNTLVADSGEEGLRQAKTSRPDCILMDVVMPGMNGRELARQMQTLSAEMKILFMSGYTSDVIVHHGVLEKGVTFIQKPFSMNTLAQKIRKALK